MEYRAEQNSPIESPPDWDLNLIDFTASFTTPCLKESFQQMPMKMQSNNIVPTTSVIGSWMEEEIRPLKSVFESLQGLNPADISVLESLLAERGAALNTPPPLPVLSDISDCITPADSFDSVPVVVDILPKEEEKGGLSPYQNLCGDSPLRDSSIENTVNLKDLFALHNFANDSLLEDFSPDPYYLGDDQKPLITESYHQQQQQLGLEESGEAAIGCVGGIADNSLLYLPAVCLEQEFEETVVEEQKKPLLLELNNNFEGTQLSSSPEIITISVEEFNRLTGSDNREAGLTKSASTSSFNQAQAPPRLLTQNKSSAALSAQEWNSTKKLAPPKDDKKSSSASSRKRRIASLDKESDEYKDKRARNNESVRKSRDKAKVRQEETESRLHVLSTENRRLQDRVDSLEKELSVLRGLFSSSSTAPPCM